jgi:hypothetical protein
MYLGEIERSIMNWTLMVQVREKWRALAITVMNIRVSQNAAISFSSCATLSFLRRLSSM